MVPEVEKHIIPLSMSSQPCRIEEPGHRVSSILFNLDVKNVREIDGYNQKFMYLDCGAVPSLLRVFSFFFFSFRTSRHILAPSTTIPDGGLDQS